MSSLYILCLPSVVSTTSAILFSHFLFLSLTCAPRPFFYFSLCHTIRSVSEFAGSRSASGIHESGSSMLTRSHKWVETLSVKILLNVEIVEFVLFLCVAKWRTGSGSSQNWTDRQHSYHAAIVDINICASRADWSLIKVFFAWLGSQLKIKMIHKYLQHRVAQQLCINYTLCTLFSLHQSRILW